MVENLDGLQHLEAYKKLIVLRLYLVILLGFHGVSLFAPDLQIQDNKPSIQIKYGCFLVASFYFFLQLEAWIAQHINCLFSTIHTPM